MKYLRRRKILTREEIEMHDDKNSPGLAWISMNDMRHDVIHAFGQHHGIQSGAVEIPEHEAIEAWADTMTFTRNEQHAIAHFHAQMLELVKASEEGLYGREEHREMMALQAMHLFENLKREEEEQD